MSMCVLGNDDDDDDDDDDDGDVILLLQAVIVDNQPCLLFNFEVQSVGAFYNAEGECVAGDPDNIEKTYYTWGMQMDTVEWEDEEGACDSHLPA